MQCHHAVSSLRLIAGLLALLSQPIVSFAHGESSATAELRAMSGSRVGGTIKLVQHNGTVNLKGRVEGLSPGKHGLHVHTNGNCDSADGISAGGHFSPLGGTHGAPTDPKRHLGDLGNINADAAGVAFVDIRMEGATLALIGSNSIINRALIVDAAADEFSQRSDNGDGQRVACGVIEQDMMAM